MTKPVIHRLGDLQLRIMKALWSLHEASVAQIIDQLGPRPPLAYTTVATMLRKMEARGLVQHRLEGRSFLYKPKVEADTVSRSLADHFVERLFGGSVAEAVNHLLTTREVSAEELDRLERLIMERRKKP